jgi:hypothetical protein
MKSRHCCTTTQHRHRMASRDCLLSSWLPGTVSCSNIRPHSRGHQSKSHKHSRGSAMWTCATAQTHTRPCWRTLFSRVCRCLRPHTHERLHWTKSCRSCRGFSTHTPHTHNPHTHTPHTHKHTHNSQQTATNNCVKYCRPSNNT